MMTALVLWALLWFSLDRWTDSPVPLWDGLITSLSVVATWMLTRKDNRTMVCVDTGQHNSRYRLSGDGNVSDRIAVCSLYCDGSDWAKSMEHKELERIKN